MVDSKIDIAIDKLEKECEKLELKKDDINILIIGPGYPKSEFNKRKYLCGELKRRGWKKTSIMEHYKTKKTLELDHKFNSLIDMLPNLLVIALFTKKGPHGGVEWEMGFIQGYHYGKFSKGKNRKHIEDFKRSVVCLIEKGAEGLITPMITEGGLKKLKNYSFTNKKEMIKRAESLALQKLKES